MNGFINVLKPVAATASDVVVCLKHVLGERKIGHLGTLDPGATGVLPIAVGQATKLFDFLTNKKKCYRAFFTFGKTTDTLDSYGSVTQTCSHIPDLTELKAALPGFIGNLQQIPPQYSAISVGGVRSYKMARQGDAVELAPRNVVVYDISALEQRGDGTFVLDITCGGGTYIRSLARDIATACNTVGYMSALIRMSSGCFDISSAYTLDELREKKAECILPIDFPLQDVPICTVDGKFLGDLDNGRRVYVSRFEEYRRIFCNGTFFGLGRAPSGQLKLDYYLKNTL